MLNAVSQARDADYVMWLLGDRIERLYAVGRRGENGAWAHVYALL